MSVNEARCIKLVVHILTAFTFLFVFIFFRLNAETILRKAKRFESTQFYQFQTNFSLFHDPYQFFPIFHNTVGYLQASQSVKSNTIFHHQLHCFLTTFNHALPILSLRNIYFWLLNKVLNIKKEILISTKNQISKTTSHHIVSVNSPSPKRKKNVIETNCKTIRRPLKQYDAKRTYFSLRTTDLFAKNLTTFPTEIGETSAF